MADPLVIATDLSKKFGEFQAVDGIDFQIAPGEAFGFLGPNGAGKTSTMKMIAATSPVTQGTLRVFGLDPATAGAAIRARLGVVPQEDNLDTELTVEENLFVGLKGRPRAAIEEAYAMFPRLKERRRNLGSQLSGGEQQMLTTARTILGQPFNAGFFVAFNEAADSELPGGQETAHH